jgi:hypothetical protein
VGGEHSRNMLLLFGTSTNSKFFVSFRTILTIIDKQRRKAATLR